MGGLWKTFLVTSNLTFSIVCQRIFLNYTQYLQGRLKRGDPMTICESTTTYNFLIILIFISLFK